MGGVLWLPGCLSSGGRMRRRRLRLRRWDLPSDSSRGVRRSKTVISCLHFFTPVCKPGVWKSMKLCPWVLRQQSSCAESGILKSFMWKAWFAYLFRFHSLRRCQTRHRSVWRRCLFGVVAISCGGSPTYWTHWRRCPRSGLSPCWFPRMRKHGFPQCSGVLLQSCTCRFKLICHSCGSDDSLLPKLLRYPPRPPPLPRPPRPAPRPLPGPGLLRPSLCGRLSLSLSLGSSSNSFMYWHNIMGLWCVLSSNPATQVFCVVLQDHHGNLFWIKKGLLSDKNW